MSGGNQIQSVTLEQSDGAPTNRITSVTNSGSTVNYDYDSAGNVINDGVHTYSYDTENRLVSVDGGATAQYKYDYQNCRVSKIVGSSVTHYVWEGSQVIAEHNGSTGAVLIDYVYVGSRMIAKISGSTTQYFLSDRLSTRLLLDASGNVAGRMAHLPFGEDFAESGTQEKHHFTTYERDNESGADYAINRQYSQGVSRFMRVDPVAGDPANPQSLNRYAYSVNDPVNKMDPLGLQWVLFCTPPGYEGQSTCVFHWLPDRNSAYPGGPPPISGGRGPTPKKEKLGKERRKEFLKFLDSEKNATCKEKLSRFGNSQGNYFDQIKSVAGEVDFVDVNSIASDKSKNWFPNVSFNGTVGQLFAKDALGPGQTLVFQTNSPRGANNGPPGIYAIGGASNAYFSGADGLVNLEHELAHYVTGITDEAFVNLYHIPVPIDRQTGQPITDSEAVDLWFKGECKAGQ